MRSLLRKSVGILAVLAAVAFTVPAEAETVTRTAPFTAGQMCYSYFNPTNTMYYGSFCHYDPPPYGYNPLNGYGDYGAPFNAVAASARNGELVVGGYEYLYAPPFAAYYLANVNKAASILEFNGSSTVGNVTVGAAISGMNVSSPYINRFQVCLDLFDMGPIGGYMSPVRLARDCFNKTSAFRDLSATATNVAANRKLKIEVYLNNAGENGGAKATVSGISYTLP